MNYKLCKQLKEAGFPIREHENSKCEHRRFPNSKDDHFPLICSPTLSELIEACGDMFTSLTRNRNGSWSTMSKSGKKYPEFDWTASDGKTPEEAVAKLWLKLHDK